MAVSKFANTSSLALGFQQNFGAAKTEIKFIGIKGELLRIKPKMGAIVYEIRAKTDENSLKDEKANMANLGM